MSYPLCINNNDKKDRLNFNKINHLNIKLSNKCFLITSIIKIVHTDRQIFL